MTTEYRTNQSQTGSRGHHIYLFRILIFVFEIKSKEIVQPGVKLLKIKTITLQPWQHVRVERSCSFYRHCHARATGVRAFKSDKRYENCIYFECNVLRFVINKYTLILMVCHQLRAQNTTQSQMLPLMGFLFCGSHLDFGAANGSASPISNVTSALWLASQSGFGETSWSEFHAPRSLTLTRG